MTDGLGTSHGEDRLASAAERLVDTVGNLAPAGAARRRTAFGWRTPIVAILLCGMVVPPLALSWCLVLAEAVSRAHSEAPSGDKGAMPALASVVAFPLAAGIAAVSSYLIARSWVAAVLAVAASRVGRRMTFGQALMIGRGRHNLTWMCYVVAAICMLVCATVLPHVTTNDAKLRTILDYSGPTALAMPALIFATVRTLATIVGPSDDDEAPPRGCTLMIATVALAACLIAVASVFARDANGPFYSGASPVSLIGHAGPSILAATLINLAAVPIEMLLLSIAVPRYRRGHRV